MAFNSVRYQLVVDVRDKAGAVLHSVVDIAPEGSTPPAVKAGDEWHVMVPSGQKVDALVTSTRNEMIFDSAGNVLFQYKFSLKEK